MESLSRCSSSAKLDGEIPAGQEAEKNKLEAKMLNHYKSLNIFVPAVILEIAKHLFK